MTRLSDELKLRSHAVSVCKDHKHMAEGDIAVFLGYTRIVPPVYLQLHKHNLVVHESDLPAGKGWSPLTWQILEGKSAVSICLFEAVEALDAGPIYFKDTMRFEGHELIDELRAIQGAKTIELVLRFVDSYPDVQGVPQKGPESFYPRRRPSDSELDPARTIVEQFNLLRTVDNETYPAFFYLHGQKYSIRIYKES